LFVEAKSGPRAQKFVKSSSRLNSVGFFLCGCKKSEVDKILADTRDELLARVFDAAARINKREDKLRRTIRDLRTRVAKCTKFDCVTYERLL
jgi:hypothetical protein